MATPADMLASAQGLLSLARSLNADANAAIAGAQAAMDTTWAQLPYWTCAPPAVGAAATLTNAAHLAVEAAEQANRAAALASAGRCAQAVAHAQAVAALFAQLEQLAGECASDTPYGTPTGTVVTSGAQHYTCLDQSYPGCVGNVVTMATAVVAEATATYAEGCPAPAPRRQRAPRYRFPLGDPPVDPATAQAQIQADLSSALPPDQLQSVITSYTGLSSLQQQAIGSSVVQLSQGKVPSWATLTPLVAGALAVAGVGAPIVAVVAAAVPLVAAILSALGIGSQDPKCTWVVGSTCFSGHIPYGPDDPAWMTFADFAQEGPVFRAAFPFYDATIACELPVIDDVLLASFPSAEKKVSPIATSPSALAKELAGGAASVAGAGGATGILGATLTPSGGASSGGGFAAGGYPGAPTPPALRPLQPSDPTLQIYLFLRSYYSAWIANAENQINGHPFATDADLLAVVAQAWNASHASTSTMTFVPATQPLPPNEGVLTSTAPGAVCTNPAGNSLADVSTPTFISQLLAGNIDGRDEPPLTIHTGPSTLAPPAPSTASSSSSAGKTFAIAAGGLTVAGVAVWLATHAPLGLFGGSR